MTSRCPDCHHEIASRFHPDRGFETACVCDGPVEMACRHSGCGHGSKAMSAGAAMVKRWQHEAEEHGDWPPVSWNTERCSMCDVVVLKRNAYFRFGTYIVGTAGDERHHFCSEPCFYLFARDHDEDEWETKWVIPPDDDSAFDVEEYVSASTYRLRSRAADETRESTRAVTVGGRA